MVNTSTPPPSSSLPDQCQSTAPVTGGGLELNTPLCIEANGSQAQMHFYVDSGDVGKTLQIRTGHGTGDGNIFHQHGTRSGLPDQYDYASNDPGTTDTLLVPNVQSGWNYIHFSTDTTFSGVTILLEYQ